MAKKSPTPSPIVVAIFMAIAVALYYFWAFPYRAALSYREEMQLFQTTSSYFAEFAGRPAGIAIYIGEFLTQFFNNYWIGSAVMTILIVLFMLSVYLTCNRFAIRNQKIINIFLSIIPATFLWFMLGDQNMTLGFVTALLMVSAGAYLYIATDSDYPAAEKYLRMIVAISLLYWLAGPLTLILTLLIIAFICVSRKVSVVNKICFAIVSQ